MRTGVVAVITRGQILIPMYQIGQTLVSILILDLPRPTDVVPLLFESGLGIDRPRLVRNA